MPRPSWQTGISRPLHFRRALVFSLLSALILIYSFLFHELISFNEHIIPAPLLVVQSSDSLSWAAWAASPPAAHAQPPLHPLHHFTEVHPPGSTLPPSHEETACGAPSSAPDIPQLTWELRQPVDASTYLMPRPPAPHPTAAAVTTREVQDALQPYLDSHAVSTHAQRTRTQNLTGIVIPAGGGAPLPASRLLLWLRFLRTGLMCKLPVEVMWRGSEGLMEAGVWRKVEGSLGPLTGMDITSAGLVLLAGRGGSSGGSNSSSAAAAAVARLAAGGHSSVVLSLLASRFRHVLLLEPGYLPLLLQLPSAFFAHPLYRATGNLMWPSTGNGGKRTAQQYRRYGLQYASARAALGLAWRSSSSALLLLDKSQHSDVLDQLLCMELGCSRKGAGGEGEAGSLRLGKGSEAEAGAQHLEQESAAGGRVQCLGVALPIAFARAGKAHLLSQVSVPPAGVFAPQGQGQGAQGGSGSGRQSAEGWALQHLLQHDSWGRPAFLTAHPRQQQQQQQQQWASPWPPALGLITAPMDLPWLMRWGMSEDPDSDTAPAPAALPLVPPAAPPLVPPAALLELSPTLTASWVREEGGALHPDTSSLTTDGCAVPTFVSLLAMKLSGLSVEWSAQQQPGCLHALQHLLGEAKYRQYAERGWLAVPMLRYLERLRRLEGEDAAAAAAGGNQREGKGLVRIPAWRPDFAPAPVGGPLLCLVRAAAAARSWLCDTGAAAFGLQLERAGLGCPPPRPSPPPPRQEYSGEEGQEQVQEYSEEQGQGQAQGVRFDKVAVLLANLLEEMKKWSPPPGLL